jgi:predicted RNA-binding protein with PIN domain
MAKPATSYRKKKVEKDELPDDSELYRDPTNTLYYTNQGLLDDAVPVLLVDGYNVCGYWMKLKKHFMKGRLDVARQKLVDELVSFSMVKEVKVVVVFDALMSGLPTHKEDFAGYSHLALFCLFSISLFTLTTQKVLSFLASVDVIFSGETCADAWIEKEARKNDLFTPKACSNRRLYENNC